MRHHTDDEAATYGFRWGQVDVTRAFEHKGHRSIYVDTDFHGLQIGVSPTGRSVRVWLDHKEMVEGDEHNEREHGEEGDDD